MKETRELAREPVGASVKLYLIASFELDILFHMQHGQ
jgi:hypothetical protein